MLSLACNTPNPSILPVYLTYCVFETSKLCEKWTNNIYYCKVNSLQDGINLGWINQKKNFIIYKWIENESSTTAEIDDDDDALDYGTDDLCHFGLRIVKLNHQQRSECVAVLQVKQVLSSAIYVIQQLNVHPLYMHYSQFQYFANTLDRAVIWCVA